MVTPEPKNSPKSWCAGGSLGPQITVLFPCLNEELTLASCISEAIESAKSYGHAFEILVADNGSEDNSVRIAESLGARVISVSARGYGNALQAGLEAAAGEFVFILDADGSYSLENIDLFLSKFEQGYDFVLGNRFAGEIKPGAMPILHKYLGNPVLSYIGRKLYGVDIGDFHCGIRAIRKGASEKLQLMSGGMEFASEMILKSSIKGLKLSEVPVTLYPDKRNRKPHLRTWRDGWRHLKFLLFYAPRPSMIVPGRVLFIIGSIPVILLTISDFRLGNVTFSVQTQLVCSIFALLGLQLGVLGKLSEGILLRKGLVKNLTDYESKNRNNTSDLAILVGFALTVFGFLGLGAHFLNWIYTGLGLLDPISKFRTLIPFSLTLAMGAVISSYGLMRDSIESILSHGSVR